MFSDEDNLKGLNSKWGRVYLRYKKAVDSTPSDQQLQEALLGSLGVLPTKPKFDGSSLSYDRGLIRLSWRDQEQNWATMEGDGNYFVQIEIPSLGLVGQVEGLHKGSGSFPGFIEFRTKDNQKVDLSSETREVLWKLINENDLTNFDAVESLGPQGYLKLLQEGIGGEKKFYKWLKSVAKERGEDVEDYLSALEA